MVVVIVRGMVDLVVLWRLFIVLPVSGKERKIN